MDTADPKKNDDSRPDPAGVPPPYPGYGKRHDIFYQYNSPEEGQAEPPPKPATPPPPQYPAVLTPEEEPYDTPKGSHKKLLVLFAVMMTIMAGVIVFLLLHGRNSSQNRAGGNSSSSSSSGGAAQNPDVVDTSCYTFTLPKPHTQITASSNCNGTYTSNGNDIVVTAIAYPYDSLDSVISAWKSTNSTYTVVTQNKANFGPYSAEQLFWNPPGNANEEDMTVLTYVLTQPLNPKYTDQNNPIYAFEIDGRYDSQSSSKTVFDSILSSWVWK